MRVGRDGSSLPARHDCDVVFDGRVVIVTGASRGIGRTTAEPFAREGATVVVHYRSDEKQTYVEAAGGRFLVHAL